MKRIAGRPAGAAGRAPKARSARKNDPVHPGSVSDPVPDSTFSQAVVEWQKQHGRHSLPWQNTRDPYRVWLSEIMLQQTQVAAVIPYYQRFLQRFPTVAELAAAPAEDVMALWSGLGYYSRARNLHRCAKRICEEYGGHFPSDPDLLADLPGIGRSTAAAISAFSYGTRAAILDGNVKRVFCRVFGIDGFPGDKPVETVLWRHAEAMLPERELGAYTQGLMDLGATICIRGRPQCASCPLAARCVAFREGRTADLPARKAKKAIPEKHTAMLVISYRDEVLLEQRPDNGIWGGLLSLPEVDALAEETLAQDGARRNALIANAVSRFGVPSGVEPLQAFVHTFTHYRLHVLPFLVRLERRLDAAAQGGHIWLDTARAAGAPLPAPVKKLLLALFSGEDLFGGA